MSPLIRGEAIDIRAYVAAVLAADLAGREPPPPLIKCVYRGADGEYDHVLAIADARDVYLAVIVDRAAQGVLGHHLLNLPQVYGIKRYALFSG